MTANSPGPRKCSGRPGPQKSDTLGGVGVAEGVLDLFQGAAFGFGNEIEGKEPGGNGQGRVQPKRPARTQDLNQREEGKRNKKVEGRVRARRRAFGDAANLERIDLRNQQPKNRAEA